MKNKIIPLLFTFFVFLGIFSVLAWDRITYKTTIAVDTTGNTFYGAILWGTGAFGVPTFSILLDSTGADEGATDTLKIAYKMLGLNSESGDVEVLHDNWYQGEIDFGIVKDWADSVKYHVTFDTLTGCIGCSLKIELGTGDSLMGNVYFQASILR
ncbi:MAG TPA: hypothetical protein ENH14_01585 [candidate division WOR-3 bacterium]|uniref:Uncharacterized protein n=1 Tax=candidate division WOR-3 bacterium TaxID=2052148 RepID=A0A7V0LUD5_UNCW3|nr:hypothetical protein [candidate division WOR-3 bacterium]